MDTHPHQPGDVSDLERRLSACTPSTAGLNADAMLFAAGRASARAGPARFLWPAATLCLTTLSAALGLWLATERSERQALAQQLRDLSATPIAMPSPRPSISDAPAETPTASEPAPDSFLAGRRALEQGLDAWLPQAVARADTISPMPPEPRILRVGWRDGLLDP